MAEKVRKQDALDYHAKGRPGKIEVIATKHCLTQRDLSLAYSPGVAHACLAIAENPDDANRYTARANLVGVVSNGTAVLGLGNIGPLASKPVMEGKAILFKRFADIDVFDLEIEASEVGPFCDAVAALEPTFGGINLEDIKAPECFEIEAQLRERMNIPVFHDDQHGTAIIATAGLINALELQGKKAEEVRVVISGAGAAGISCARMFFTIGVRPENILMLDSRGVLSEDRRDSIHAVRQDFVRDTTRRTLAEALDGADVFCGVSVGGIVTADMVRSMADRPIVFALANPDPEIGYKEAREARDDVIAATGRSDFPNQVNNVLGFPYIFRGALDVRASGVTDEMKRAAAVALAELTRQEVPEAVKRAYEGEDISFGPEYIIPKPLDPRALQALPPAVARAAMESGVARLPITDWAAYRQRLAAMHRKGRSALHRVATEARHHSKRIVFPEGEELRILRAVEIIAEEGMATPILLGNPATIRELAEDLGLRLQGVELVDASDRTRREQHAQALYELRARHGVTPQTAKRLLARPVYQGLMMLRAGEADGLVGGLGRPYADLLKPALQLLGPARDVERVAGCVVAFFDDRTVVLADTTVNPTPNSEELAEIALHGTKVAQLFGLEPVVSFLSFSNFGDNNHPRARVPREAAEIFRTRHPDIPSDGEMHPDTALNPAHSDRFFPHSLIQGGANVLVMPSLEAGLTAYKLIKELARVEMTGPLLSGLTHPINIVNYADDEDEIVHVTALTVVAAAAKSRALA